MPYAAAKAMAATFCWKIRHALTPLFGTDFPSLCVHPRDRARYGRMQIDQEIVKEATETANLYRMLELRLTPISVSSRQQDIRPTPRSSPYPTGGQPVTQQKYATSVSSYGSAPEYPDSFCSSPVSPVKNPFTPVNTPRSVDGPVRIMQSGLRAYSPHGHGHDLGHHRHESYPRTLSYLKRPAHIPVHIPSSHPRIPSPENSHTVPSISSMSASERTSSDESSESDSSIYFSPSSRGSDSDSVSISLDLNDDNAAGNVMVTKRAKSRSQKQTLRPEPERRSTRSTRPGQLAREIKAAHALLSLYMQNATSDLDEMPPRSEYSGDGNARGRKRRRASA